MDTFELKPNTVTEETAIALMKAYCLLTAGEKETISQAQIELCAYTKERLEEMRDLLNSNTAMFEEMTHNVLAMQMRKQTNDIDKRHWDPYKFPNAREIRISF